MNVEHDSLHATNCWQETKRKMRDLKAGHKNWLNSFKQQNGMQNKTKVC
jgi:hypothetical protein